MFIGLLLGLSAISNATPPVKFQGNTYAVIVTVDDPNTKDTCGVAPEGYHFMACEFKDDKSGMPIILIPNPCKYDAIDPYAHLLCHELGHVNGWNYTHDN